MKSRKRTGWVRAGGGLTAAIVLAVAVAACGGSSTSITNHATNLGTTLYGTLPTAGTPTSGGTVTFGQLTGDGPTFMFPIDDCTDTSGANSNLDAVMFEPLYNGPEGTRPVVDYPDSVAASAPVASNGGKTYTITLKTGLKWSNGAPVDSSDVIFFVDLLQAALKVNEGNWCQLVAGQFPQDITSMSAPNAHTVVFNLNKPYNEGYFLYNQLQDTNFGIYPLPSTQWNIAATGGPHLNYTVPANATKIYNYLFKEGGILSTFATNPLWKDVDGPYTLSSFNVTNGSYNLVPNKAYTGPSPSHVSEVSVETYTSRAAMMNAYKSGTLDVGQFDEVYASQIPLLKRDGYDTYGGPGWDYFDNTINFEDAAGDWDNVIKQLYARQALAHLIDQATLIKGVFKGAAVPDYATVPSEPSSPYTPSDAVNDPYPYSPSAAVALLKDNGWKVVPGGTSTCEKPGTGAGECGAGIPKGTAFGGTYVSEPQAETPATDLMAETLIGDAKKYAGIDFTLRTLPVTVIFDNYNDAIPQGKAVVNKWALSAVGGFEFDYYPTAEGSFNTGASFNEGDYSDAEANKLMAASVSSANPDAVIAESTYLAKQVPVLFWPDYDETFSVNDKLGGPADSWLNLSLGGFTPQYWYFKKK